MSLLGSVIIAVVTVVVKELDKDDQLTASGMRSRKSAFLRSANMQKQYRPLKIAKIIHLTSLM